MMMIEFTSTGDPDVGIPGDQAVVSLPVGLDASPICILTALKVAKALLPFMEGSMDGSINIWLHVDDVMYFVGHNELDVHTSQLLDEDMASVRWEDVRCGNE